MKIDGLIHQIRKGALLNSLAQVSCTIGRCTSLLHTQNPLLYLVGKRRAHFAVMLCSGNETIFGHIPLADASQGWLLRSGLQLCTHMSQGLTIRPFHFDTAGIFDAILAVISV